MSDPAPNKRSPVTVHKDYADFIILYVKLAPSVQVTWTLGASALRCQSITCDGKCERCRESAKDWRAIAIEDAKYSRASLESENPMALSSKLHGSQDFTPDGDQSIIICDAFDEESGYEQSGSSITVRIVRLEQVLDAIIDELSRSQTAWKRKAARVTAPSERVADGKK
jgi:hypothetical protein